MKYLHLSFIIALAIFRVQAQPFPNSNFETGTTAGCHCPTGYVCANDAGRVVDGVHPVFVVGNPGCVTTTTNRAPQLGAHGGTGSVYFYAGADRLTTPNANFVGGEELCICTWYTGPQGAGASGQNTANAFFSFGINGTRVGPNVFIPVNTPWTQHCHTVIMTAGSRNFNIMSGGAAQYSFWFDDFTVQACVLLPTELLDFKADYQSGEVLLTWRTETETNNGFFTLEKSPDGQNFEILTVLQGAGNSNDLINYHFTDPAPYIGYNYYRLRMTNFDGSVSYSPVVVVNSSPFSANITIYPNPAEGVVNLRIDENIADGRVKLLNAIGQTVFVQTVTQGINHLDLDVLPAGIYNCFVLDGEKQVHSTKLILNN